PRLAIAPAGSHPLVRAARTELPADRRIFPSLRWRAAALRFQLRAREAGGPVRRPLRKQTDPSVVIGTRKIKEVVVLAEAHFVFWLAAGGNQSGPRFHTGGVQI